MAAIIYFEERVVLKNYPSYTILADQSFTIEHLFIRYNNTTLPMSSENIALIEKIWGNKKNASKNNNTTLFNSNLFRLDRLETSHSNTVMHLSNTSYKDYVGTRDPSYQGFRSNAIGTAILPILSDGHIPLGRRSMNADANPGKLFTFGGFFENPNDINGKTGCPCIFKCALRELEEELATSFKKIKLTGLGVVYDNTLCHPEVSFLAEIPMTRDEIKNLNWNIELSSLIFIRPSEISNLIFSHYSEITPTLIGGLKLLENFIKMRRQS